MDNTLQNRTRTYSWQDPAILKEAVTSMSGIEYLRAIVAGELPPPPVAALIDMTMTEVEEGRTVFCIEPAEFHYNPMGILHGGIIATILDSALGCSIQTLLPVGVVCPTLELKVSYMRPVTIQAGPVYAEAKILHVSKRVASAEARLTDKNGKLYSHATTTCMLVHL